LKTCPTALLSERNHTPLEERPASELSDAGLTSSVEG
jgi:hypothetical protein